MSNLNLFKNTSVYTLGSLGQKAGKFLLLPLYTTYLNGGEFGAIALIILMGAFLTDLVQYPIGAGLLRFYYAPEYKKNKDKLVYSLFVFGVIVSIIFIIGFVYLNNTLAGLLWDSKSNIAYPKLVRLIYAYSPMIIIQPISSFGLTILRIREEAKYYAIVSLVRIVIEISLAFTGLIMLKWGIFTPVYAQMGGLLAVIVLVIPFVFRHYVFKLSYKSLIDPLKYSLPLLPSAYSEILVKSGDRYLIKLLVSLDATGIYTVAYQVSGAIEFVLSKPLEQAFLPMALKLEESPDKLKVFTQDSMYVFTFVGGILALTLAVYAQDILKIFARSEEFWIAWKIIPVVSLSFLFKGISKFSGMGLTMKKRSWLQSLGMIFAAGLNVIFNFIFIPIYGILGAALATMISYLFWNFWKAYFSYKYYNLLFDWVKVFSILSIGGVMYVLSLWLFNGLPLYLSLLFKLFPVIAYIVITWYSGLLSNNLKNYIIKIVNQVKLKII